MTLQPGSERLTVCLIDGNTLAACAVEIDDFGVKVLASKVVELPRLAERIERERHPIFMDVFYIQVEDAEAIRQGFRQIFSDPTFVNPVLGLFPPEKVVMHQLEGPATPEARSARLVTLLGRIQAANPLYYPSVCAHEETVREDGTSVTSLFSARLADLITMAMQYDGLGTRFQGLAISQVALNGVLRQLEVDGDRPQVTLLDIGKLRTTYSLRLPSGRIVHYPIPVGLARDDMHYFSSAPPVMTELSRMHERFGGLLFPAESTPSPLFNARKSNVHIDCTRFVVQIATYASRAQLRMEEDGAVESSSNQVRLLAGRASRLPGLREFIQARTRERFDFVDPLRLQDLTLSPKVNPAVVGDAISAPGGAFAYRDRARSRFGLLLPDNRPQRLPRGGTLNASGLEPGALYVFERPFDKVEV